MSISDIFTIIDKYTPYIGRGVGGINISGGEPLYQPELVFLIIRAAHVRNLHVALDTSGWISFDRTSIVETIIREVDLVMLCPNIFGGKEYLNLTDTSQRTVNQFIALSDKVRTLVIDLLPYHNLHLIRKPGNISNQIMKDGTIIRTPTE